MKRKSVVPRRMARNYRLLYSSKINKISIEERGKSMSMIKTKDLIFEYDKYLSDYVS